jgi:single-stranded DNA-binding protein
MLESWNNDARFLKNYLYQGRQLSIGGKLLFESYQDKEGKQCAKYKVRVRSQQYALFGKNKEAEEARKEIIETVKEIVQEAKPTQNPKSVNWQSSPVVPENDDVPF